MDLKIGDKVKLISDVESILKKGMTGIIVSFIPELIGIAWDGFTEGHDCNGDCQDGVGYYVYPNKLVLIKQIKISKKELERKKKKIIKEIKANKEYSSQFKDITKEVNKFSEEQVINWFK